MAKAEQDAGGRSVDCDGSRESGFDRAWLIGSGDTAGRPPAPLVNPRTEAAGNAAMPLDTIRLWKAFHEEGDQDARNAIVDRNMPLVHHIARQIHRRVGNLVSLDELVNAGCIGLLNAIDSFDSGRGLAFSTHAVPRIRGAILDDLRRSDIASRAVRRRQRSIADAERKLSNQLGRMPADAETARALKIDVNTLWRWKSDARRTSTLSLDRGVNPWEGDGSVVTDLIRGPMGVEVEDRLTTDREIRILEHELRLLTERERIVLTLYYREELKLRQIGEVLGLTESCISKIRTKALLTLRSRMSHLREPA